MGNKSINSVNNAIRHQASSSRLIEEFNRTEGYCSKQFKEKLRYVQVDTPTQCRKKSMQLKELKPI